MGAGAQPAGLGRARGTAVGDDRGDPFSEISGSLELRNLGWGAQGSEAAGRGTQRPPRGCSPVAASGRRPPPGPRGPSEERSRVFRAISLLVTRVHLTHPPRFRTEGIWVQALLFWGGVFLVPCTKQKGLTAPHLLFHWGPLGQHWERLGSAPATHTFPPSQAAFPGSGDRLSAGSEHRKSQSQVF